LEPITENIQVYSEIDPNFDSSQLSSYRLVMKVGHSLLTSCVFDGGTGKVLCAEKFSYSKALTDNALIVRLQNVKSNHNYLDAKFWKEVVVLVNNSYFSCVPENFFDEDALPEIMNFNQKNLPKSSTFFHSNIAKFHHVIPYAIGSDVVEWFREEYVNEENNTQIRFQHATAAFLEGLAAFTPLSGTAVNLFADEERVYISLVEGSSLRFINSFEYGGNAASMLYYLLTVLEELKLAPNKTTVKVWGTIKPKSEHIQMLEKNVKTVIFGKKLKDIQMSVALSSYLPEHENFDVYSAGIQPF